MRRVSEQLGIFSSAARAHFRRTPQRYDIHAFRPPPSLKLGEAVRQGPFVCVVWRGALGGRLAFRARSMGCKASREAAGPAPGSVRMAEEVEVRMAEEVEMAKLAAEAWVAEEVRLAKEARALEKALVKTAEELVAEAELAELRRLTPEQEAAAAKAAQRIGEVAAAAEAAPERRRGPRQWPAMGTRHRRACRISAADQTQLVELLLAHAAIDVNQARLAAGAKLAAEARLAEAVRLAKEARPLQKFT